MTTFAELHHGRLPLLLPNAWDVASALTFAGAGHPAVGTTSMGLAASEGHPDGRRASRAATARLAEALAGVEVQVSIDIEDGYEDEPAAVAAFVGALPVAGVNIEDSSRDRLVPLAALAAKVAAIKSRRPDRAARGRDPGPDERPGRARYVAGAAGGPRRTPGQHRSLPYCAALQAALRTAESVRTGTTPRDAVAYPGLQNSLLAYAAQAASASGPRSG
jgi:hypothetical protein